MKADKNKTAFTLFMQGDLTQKEIAERVCVTEKTMGVWVKQGQWEERRNRALTEPVEIMEVLRGFVIQMQKVISSEARTPTNSEADTILKLIKSVDLLDKDIESPFAKKLFDEFKQYIRHHDTSLAEQFRKHYNEYVEQKASGSK